MNILLLSNSVSAEQPFLQQMNALGHEVFCSQELLKKLTVKRSYREFLPYFETIIFSESVSNQMIEDVLKNVVVRNHQIFRRTDLPTPNDQITQEIEARDATFTVPIMPIPLSPTLEQLRELLSSYEFSVNQPKVDMVVHAFPYKNFSKKEKQVLQVLTESLGKTVHRETICESVWGDEKASNSHLIQLSNIIKRIKYKFDEQELENWSIQTVWGQGYKLVRLV